MSRITIDHFWRVVEHVDLILLIILASIGMCLSLLGFFEIRISTFLITYIFGLVALLAFALLLVLRKVEESKKLIASVVPKVEVELLEDRDAFYKKVEKEVVLAENPLTSLIFIPVQLRKQSQRRDIPKH